MDGESLKDYLRRFSEEVPRVRRADDEILKNFIIAGIKPGIDFSKELQLHEPKTLSDFYSRAQPHKAIEERMAKLVKILSSRGQWETDYKGN